MNIAKRAGNYFFILGALLAIFSGAFSVSPEMKQIKTLLLVITGLFVGLLNIEEEREIHFLIASVAFIVAGNAISGVLSSLLLMDSIGDIISNFIIFTSSASVVVGLKLIFSYSSDNETISEELSFVNPKSEFVWNITVFIAVCLAFVTFILEAFFYTSKLGSFLFIMGYAVIIIFVVDVVVLFLRSKDFKSFLRFHWADIIAIIPFSGVFQLAKVIRLVKIARIFSKTSKLARVSKISHSAKFFSHNSGFNHYMKKEK